MRRLITIFIYISLSFVSLPSFSQLVPENAFVSGNRWYCMGGYYQSGSKCLKLHPPENAFVSGNRWYCMGGYKRSGNSCTQMSEKEKVLQQQQIHSSSRSYNYDVSGYGDTGYVTGNIDARGDRYVDGYITLEDGSEVYFDGEWIGKGEIEGYDEDGNYYELEVE